MTTKELTYGPEIEFILVNSRTGDVMGGSFELDKLARHDGAYPFIQRESVDTMVELSAPNTPDLLALGQDMVRYAREMTTMAGKIGASPIPTGPFTEAVGRELAKERYLMQQQAYGEETNDIWKQVVGTHVHEDQAHDPASLLTQVWLKIAMDPAFVLMAASPYHAGRNGAVDTRVKNIRDAPHIQEYVQLMPYPSSLDGLREMILSLYTSWTSRLEDLGWARETVEEAFTPYNCAMGPLRACGLRGDAQRKITLEVRGPDANLLSRVLAFVALHKGATRRTLDDRLRLTIDEAGPYFQPQDGAMRVPPHATLTRLAADGWRKGLGDEDVHRYLDAMVSYAAPGLEPGERWLLEPFAIELDGRKTFANDIMAHAKGHGIARDSRIVDNKAGCDLRLYVAERFKEDLDELGQRLSPRAVAMHRA